MQVFLLILFGFASGILGGMGMGGGTLLVPLLTFLCLPQKICQSANLLSFIPMCAVALIFHKKHGLVVTKDVWRLTIPATLAAAVGAFFAGNTADKVLRICFAIFLIAVGIWQLVVAIRFALRQKRRKRYKASRSEVERILARHKSS